MPTTQPFALHPPLFISARLMAAVRVTDTGPTIHIEPVRRDNQGRVVWRYIIEDNDHSVIDDATDLRSGTGDDIDPRTAMTTLLGYLGAAADAYRHTMTGAHSDNADLFPVQVMEWAYDHDDELAALAIDLEQPDTESTGDGPAGPAGRDARWRQVWARTGCADCAGAAADGEPWGLEHCWATHRPHLPAATRTLTDDRRDQGFVSQAHLDAFYAHRDHVQACTECGRPGPPAPIDDGMQPTTIECPTGRDLFRRSFRENFEPPPG